MTDKQATPKKGREKPASSANRLSDLIRKGSHPKAGDDDDTTVRTFEIKSFILNHIWGGEGYPAGDPPGGNYRAKLTLHCKVASTDINRIAELYFYDQTQGLHPNPIKEHDFPPGKGYYVLYFPMNTLQTIMLQLYHAKGRRMLTYSDRAWCIETTEATSAAKKKAS